MSGYLLRRLLAIVPVILVISVLVFSVTRLLPGDIALVILGDRANPKDVDALREELGMNKPAPVQYVVWASQALRGHLGNSVSLHMPVGRAVLERLPVSLELMALGVVTGLLIGIPAGIISAVRRNSLLDLGVSGAAVAGLAMPGFWLAILLILFLGVHLRWLPVSGYVPFEENPLNNIKHLVMPSFVLGVEISAIIARFTRSEVLEVLNQDYVRTARAKGLTPRVVIIRHALRNALLPTVTNLGLLIGTLFSGAVVLEIIFALPGVGRLGVDAVYARDFPLLQGVVLTTTLGVLASSLVVDLAYAYLDPRVRYGR